MNAWRQSDVHVNGVRLRTYRAGNGHAPLLFVHGFTDNALYWSRTAAALSENWDVAAYDARGHGASDLGGPVFDDATRANDALAVIDALGLVKPVAIGHSMGGSTITNAAAQRPGAFRALVLEDPAWWEFPPETSAEQRQQAAAAGMRERNNAWRDWVRQLQSVDDDKALEMVRTGSPEWGAGDAALSRDARQQVNLAQFEHYPPAEAPWRAAIAACACPVLLLLGSERNAIIKPETADEVTRLAPGARWVQIPGAGHAIRYDQFEAYFAALSAFLATV